MHNMIGGSPVISGWDQECVAGYFHFHCYLLSRSWRETCFSISYQKSRYIHTYGCMYIHTNVLITVIIIVIFLADSDIHTHTQEVQYVHIYFVIIHVYVRTCIYSFQDNRYENQRYVLKAGTTKNPDEVCAYITHGKRMCITSFTGNECVQMNISVRTCTWKNA